MSDDPEQSSQPASQRPGGGVLAVRYGIPAVLILAGIVVLFVGGEGANLEGWALFTGAGLSVLLLNVLYRAGVTGDAERDREEEARAFFDSHGYWPGEGDAEQAQPAAGETEARPGGGTARRLEQPSRERSDSSRYGPPPIEAPPPRLPRPPRRRGD
jgi:hypothetical protein